MITHAETEFQHRSAQLATHGDYAATEALRVLATTNVHLAAITGGQTDRMTRDDGWRLLSIGRNLERLCFLAPAMVSSFESGAVHDRGGFEALIALYDSTITFHAQYQQSHEIAALLDLLVLDPDNPRSLRWVIQNLRGRLAKLSGLPQEQSPLAQLLPDPADWTLLSVCAQDAEGQYSGLLELLSRINQAALKISDEVSLRYFTHASDAGLSVEA